MEKRHQDKEYWLTLIIDSLTGVISNESRQQLDEWRNASDENEQQFAEMQKMWDALSFSEYNQQFDDERAYRLFRERVRAVSGKKDSIQVKSLPGIWNNLLLRVASFAAVLGLLIVLSYFTYLYVAAAKSPALISEISVPNGSKTQMKLQDGTNVWLNAGSRIQYNSDFGKNNRTVTLFGEAYFEVTKDDRSPFIVEVGDVKVKVLGTRFNINAYEENNGLIVALLEGSVEVNANESGVVTLTPGSIARYYADKRHLEVSENDTGDMLAWLDNRLVFNGETFEQIVRKLERKYNVKVNTHNKRLKKREFAGDFTNNETIEQIFTVMSVNGQFRYQISGNVIDVY